LCGDVSAEFEWLCLGVSESKHSSFVCMQRYAHVWMHTYRDRCTEHLRRRCQRHEPVCVDCTVVTLYTSNSLCAFSLICARTCVIALISTYIHTCIHTHSGHTVRAVCESFQLAKDCGFKVVTHMMPDLPNMGMERDLISFRVRVLVVCTRVLCSARMCLSPVCLTYHTYIRRKQEFFENPAFRADGMKLYPTLVIRGTGLYELWKTGKYRNYPPDVLVDLVAKILAMVPPWTRIYRVQRDIPMPLVTSGVEHGNLRELALARMQELGLRCRDVRPREVGIQDVHHKIRPDQVRLCLLVCSCVSTFLCSRSMLTTTHRLSLFVVTTPPMVGGKRSCPMKTRSRIFSLVCCDCVSARPIHSGRS